MTLKLTQGELRAIVERALHEAPARAHGWRSVAQDQCRGPEVSELLDAVVEHMVGACDAAMGPDAGRGEAALTRTSWEDLRVKFYRRLADCVEEAVGSAFKA